MGKRHNTLSDDILRNSKYIATLENELGIDDFKKEYKKQYDIMLNVFQTLIKVNNILFADSNKNIYDKKLEILDTLTLCLYGDLESDYIDSDKEIFQYSTREIKNLIDGHTRNLFNSIKDWYYDLRDLNEITRIKQEVEKEMTLLENIAFDKVVKGNIEYEKNKDSNYKIYISKFSNLYADYMAFREQYKDDFNNMYGIDLTSEEMRYITFIYNLVAYANNGIVKTLYDKDVMELDLSERSSNAEYYKAYLDLLHLDIKDDNLFKKNSETFLEKIIVVSKRLADVFPSENVNEIEMTDYINRFDYYYFMVSIKDIIDGLIEVQFDNALINKITSDLKDVYELLVQKDYKGAFDKICPIIERNKNIYERLS